MFLCNLKTTVKGAFAEAFKAQSLMRSLGNVSMELQDEGASPFFHFPLSFPFT